MLGGHQCRAAGSYRLQRRRKACGKRQGVEKSRRSKLYGAIMLSSMGSGEVNLQRSRLRRGRALILFLQSRRRDELHQKQTSKLSLPGIITIDIGDMLFAHLHVLQTTKYLGSRGVSV